MAGVFRGDPWIRVVDCYWKPHPTETEPTTETEPPTSEPVTEEDLVFRAGRYLQSGSDSVEIIGYKLGEIGEDTGSLFGPLGEIVSGDGILPLNYPRLWEVTVTRFLSASIPGPIDPVTSLTVSVIGDARSYLAGKTLLLNGVPFHTFPTDPGEILLRDFGAPIEVGSPNPYTTEHGRGEAGTPPGTFLFDLAEGMLYTVTLSGP